MFANKQETLEDNLKHYVRDTRRVGMVVFIFLFLGFGLWSLLAPIDSAAIAQGTVVLDSNKKTIQHLEGGIISEILVSEGMLVKRGQVLIKLKSTAAEAREQLIRKQLYASLAKEARLLAESSYSKEINFPKELQDINGLQEEVKKIVAGEKRLFETRRRILEGRLDILSKKVAQLDERIQGLRAQESSITQQLKLLLEEKNSITQLVQQGQATKPRLLELQRRYAQLEGNKGEYKSSIAKVMQEITETNLEKINLENSQLNQVEELLRETQKQISDLREQKRAASEVLERTVITAPQSGVVTGMKYFTIGGVISPGVPILDIIPQDDVLVIEAKVSLLDIDVVQVGLQSRVRLSAFSTRQLPILEGKVVYLSADKFIDEATRMPYYKAKIAIEQSQLDRLVSQISLYPGMSAEVLIVTGERTFMQYMLDPIRSSFNKAFRES